MQRAAIMLLLCATGCVSAYPGRQRIPVTSEPSGASVRLECDGIDQSWGATPTAVVLSRYAEHCSVTIARSGYDTVTVALSQRYTSEPVTVDAADAVATAAVIGAGLLGGRGVHVSLPMTPDGRPRQRVKHVPEVIEVVLQPESVTPP